MTSADAMRASDGDRDRVVRALQEQVGEGRLTLAEFEERSSRAYDAKTIADLRVLTKDLPIDPFGPTVAGTPWQGPFPMPAVPPWAARYQDGRPPMRRVSPLAVVGGVLLTLFVVQVVVGAVAWGAFHIFPFLFPLLIVAFVLLRAGGRRRFR
jgi:Domain of unknown function (DUF1707)